MPTECEPYQILSEVGRGGMGVVYRARDPILDRIVAIKMIGATGGTDARLLQQRLFREGRSVASLSHPNIVTVYQMAKQGDGLYIAMEFVNGPTLERWLAADPAPVRSQVLEVLRQIAAGLDYAHRKGIVHRDIKPANILMDENGVPHITDFGLAKGATSTQLTQTGMQVGTPHYLSPEQAQGRPLDGQSDQFSLAVIAYEVLTGRKPFDSEEIASLMFKIVFEEPAAPHILNPALSAPVDAVFLRAFAKDPAARYPSCVDFVNSLEAACAATAPTPIAAAAPIPKKKWIAVAAASVLLVAAGVAAGTRNRSVPPPQSPPAQQVAVGQAVIPVPAPASAPPPTAAEPKGTQPKTPVGTADRKVSPAKEPTVETPKARPEAAAVKKAGEKPPEKRPEEALGMEGWENPREWRNEGGWLIHKGGNIVPYGVSPFSGNLTFSAIVPKGKRLQWVLNLRDSKNYALFQLDKKQFLAKDVVNGSGKDRAKLPLSVTEGLYQIQIAVSPGQVLTSLHTGGKWITLENWTNPGRDLTAGKFGFFIPGSDEVGIVNFKLAR